MRMRRPLQHKLGRRFTGLLYAILVLVVGSYAARQLLAEYVATSAMRSRSLSDARQAVELFGEDPNAQRTVGVLLLENGDSREAVNAFEKAVSLRDLDYRSWQMLGTARYASHDLHGAEEAYRKAIALAPHYSQPNYLIGKLLLESGRHQEGFKALSRSAENSLSIFPQVVELADYYYPNDAAAIEQASAPRTIEANTYLARYFITRSLMTPNTLSFLFGSEISEAAKKDFIGLLIEKQNYSLAHDLWATTVASDAKAGSELVFDGGFEHTTGTSQGAFGWNIAQELSGVAVSRTQQNPHSGSYAIRIKYSGATSIGKIILSQLILVRPGSSYVLKFYYRSPEILSASSPLILVTDPTGTELGRSAILKGTENNWTEISVNFTSKQMSAINIALLRPACDATPCPIFGELSLDDLLLVDAPLG